MWQIIKNEDLEELIELGSGTFGTVYHGKWRGTDVAIKRIKKSCFTGRSSEQERLVRLQLFFCLKLHRFGFKIDVTLWDYGGEYFSPCTCGIMIFYCLISASVQVASAH